MSNGSPGNAKYWQAFVDLQMEIAEALQDRAVERAMDGRVKPVLYLEGEAKMQRSTTLAGGRRARAERHCSRAGYGAHTCIAKRSEVTASKRVRQGAAGGEAAVIRLGRAGYTIRLDESFAEFLAGLEARIAVGRYRDGLPSPRIAALSLFFCFTTKLLNPRRSTRWFA